MQSRLHSDPSEARISWWLCLAASLIGGLFLLLIFVVGWMALGPHTWSSSQESEAISYG